MNSSDNDKQNKKNHPKQRREGEPVAENPDRTVIKGNSNTRVGQKPVQNDKTNIGKRPSSNGTGKPKSPDVTRFKQGARPDKSSATRVAPPKRQPQPNQAEAKPRQDRPANGNQSQLRILKDRFLLEKVLGVGGMGVVYKAKDRLKVEAHDRDPYVAIKVLSDEFKSHPEAFIALQRESRKSQRIAHPNTVKVYDFDRDGDVVFMTMEYLDGKPLDQLIRQYKATGLPEDDAWEIISGLCSALIHAHEENIVHSDFKPGNVFITNEGMAKIFDFGIARAVANVDRNDGKSIDKTVFDAGNLGALTPAYASLEMLQGKTPDVRDDVYALGCVIYEIFTGEHPFNKLPADEAFNKKLKPKRISGIGKRRWKAIEKSLAFKREDRIESVEKLNDQLFTKFKTSYKLATAIVVILALLAVIYMQAFKQEPAGFSEDDIRNQLEFKIRFDLFKENIEKLLAEPTFSIEWEQNIWEEIKGVSELLPTTDDEWLISTKQQIYQLYLSKIRKTIKDYKLARAKIYIDNAHRYTDDASLLEKEKLSLAAAIKNSSKRKLLAEEEKKKQYASQIKVEQKKKAEKKKLDSFNLALNNVNQQLQCQSRLNMRDFDIAVKKLRSLDKSRYRKLERKIVNALAACINKVGKTFPERAEESKKYALRIFRNNPTIAAISIKSRDACDLSIAGLGARGKRTLCQDKIRGIGEGPDLVVVPANGSQAAFAVGKYEVSVKELNKFCKSTGRCSKLATANEYLPATNVPINTVKSYLAWLSKQTGQKYRLPTRNEWSYAANSKSSSLDPNRNCELSSRGIKKGGDLVKITTGKQNSWGLVNYVGNAQEWVYDKGRKLIAVGGSFQDSMEKCNTRTWMAHSGGADKVTGFRVVREIKRK